MSQIVRLQVFQPFLHDGNFLREPPDIGTDTILRVGVLRAQTGEFGNFRIYGRLFNDQRVPNFKGSIQSGSGANELQKLIEHSLDHLKSSFHAVLQESARKYYDPNVTDNSKAFIDPQSLLPLIKRNGDVIHTLGGGQRQLLVLAHIISLAELRRNLHAQLDAIGIKTGKLDDQSFFLDSVFAPCDEDYAEVVAKFLPGKVRQMMILVATQQWHDKIRAGLEDAVDRAYVFKLHTNNPDKNIENYQVRLGKKQLNLLDKIPANQEPYSTIEEVK